MTAAPGMISLDTASALASLHSGGLPHTPPSGLKIESSPIVHFDRGEPSVVDTDMDGSQSARKRLKTEHGDEGEGVKKTRQSRELRSERKQAQEDHR